MVQKYCWKEMLQWLNQIVLKVTITSVIIKIIVYTYYGPTLNVINIDDDAEGSGFINMKTKMCNCKGIFWPFKWLSAAMALGIKLFLC